MQINTSKTIEGKKEESKQILPELLESNNGNGNNHDESVVASKIELSVDDIYNEILLLNQRLLRVEKNSDGGNRNLPLKDFNNIGRLIEGNDITSLVDEINVFIVNKEVLSMRFSYKKLYEESLNKLIKCTFILNQENVKISAIRNLLGRVQDGLLSQK